MLYICNLFQFIFCILSLYIFNFPTSCFFFFYFYFHFCCSNYFAIWFLWENSRERRCWRKFTRKVTNTHTHIHSHTLRLWFLIVFYLKSILLYIRIKRMSIVRSNKQEQQIRRIFELFEYLNINRITNNINSNRKLNK